ncbi:Acetyltransferase, GNAT family [Rhizobiales bacterium GAS113]|nr:Acetyltransferase, GNAT family [Rhizobiales bacterium GAS113]
MTGVPVGPRVGFRDLVPADTDAILDLWVAAWSAAMPMIDFEARREWFRDWLAQLRQEGFALRGAVEGKDGLDTDGPVIGFIALSPPRRHLDHIALKPDRWGSGLGAALLAEAKRLSPQGLVLDVNQANHRAVAFYEKQGFRRLRADRNPNSGLATWWYVWGDAEPPPRVASGE